MHTLSQIDLEHLRLALDDAEYVQQQCQCCLVNKEMDDQLAIAKEIIDATGNK